jgi:type I restriction enzyme, R subunit
MSNFAFLKTTDWIDIYKAARRAETYTLADARTAVFHGRRAVEVIVEWLYAFDPAFRHPYDDNLNALMADFSFKDNVPYGVREKMHALRKLGNQAVHSRRAIEPGMALAVIKELFHISYWFARTYTPGDPNAIPDRFDADLLPPPARDLARQSRAQLKQLETQLQTQDDDLRRLRQENAQLRAQLEAAQAQTALTRVVNAAIPDTHDYSEAETRAILIDALLREAGWDPGGPNAVEYRVEPMPNPRGFGYADYVLWGADGLPLAVVEAKKTSASKEKGKRQAELYADALEQMHGQRPIIFYTNGYEIALWDDLFYPPRQVQGFYNRDQLARLIQRRTLARPPDSIKVNPQIVDRHYQLESIARISQHFAERHRKALVVMATGTGKTRTAVALVDVLMRANWVKRVLFLADRTALVRQAERAFKAHLPASQPVNLVELADKEAARDARVVLSTHHTMLNLLDKLGPQGEKLFGVGHFDLVIIDEAHRSVYQKFGAIFDYFDSLLLGLTATPKDEVDRNTYRLFDLERGVPTAFYELETAVADGYLVPPRPVETGTRFLREGIHYDDLSDAEKEEWDRIEWDESGAIPDAVDPAALNQWLFNADTVDSVLKALMQHGLKVAGGDRLGKTIIFAKNQRHADFIVQRFDVHYPHLAGKFAGAITHEVKYAHDLIDDFGLKEDDPHIAVSVDMLDTGIDVPEVLNLVFFKLVRSKTKFWQMLGRGTRLCPDLLGPDQDKAYFLVFDFCQNFEFFRYNPQGQPDSNLPKPLSQRIFEARLDLLEVLGNQLDPGLTPLRKDATDRLYNVVANMNLDNFLVRPQRRHVEPFRQRQRWDHLTPADLHKLKQHVANLPSELEEEPETAKRFDLLVLHLQLALLTGQERAISTLRYRIKETAERLNGKHNIPAVAARMELIEAVQTEDYWSEVTPNQLEDLRRSLREVTRFIDKREQKVITTDFEDELGELKPAWMPEVARGVDIAQYRKKVTQFIRAHEDYVVIQKIRWALPLTAEDLAALEDFFFAADEIGSRDDFVRAFGAAPGLPQFIRGLVGLDRKAAKERFKTFLDQSVYTADQIQFVNFIIDHLTRNGTMDPALLYERPFTDFHYAGPEGVFSDGEVEVLVKVIREVNAVVG